MEIFPAIDIRNSSAVRLTKGDYNNMKVYSDTPLAVAEEFLKLGATNLHIVDLDAARTGTPANPETIKELAQLKGLFTELGGGIRDLKRIEYYLNLGINRIILGTAAVKDPEFLKAAIKEFGSKIAVGVDAKDGFVAVSGWEEVTSVPSFEFCEQLLNLGVKTVIYTDISKDGTLSGTNLEAYKTLSNIKGLNVIASGGITFENEIVELDNMGIYGAILGKALYEGRLNLKRALELSGGINKC